MENALHLHLWKHQGIWGMPLEQTSREVTCPQVAPSRGCPAPAMPGDGQGWPRPPPLPRKVEALRAGSQGSATATH